jgi:hypothetical protein
MDVLIVSHKGKNLDILQRLHIYKAAKKKPILNEQHISDSNVFFDILLDNVRYDWEECWYHYSIARLLMDFTAMISPSTLTPRPDSRMWRALHVMKATQI